MAVLLLLHNRPIRRQRPGGAISSVMWMSRQIMTLASLFLLLVVGYTNCFQSGPAPVLTDRLVRRLAGGPTRIIIMRPTSTTCPPRPNRILPVAPGSSSSSSSSASSSSSSTALSMFMGSDGGILGIGAPELFTILLVGYFVLGPSDLYKIVKEIGKFIQNIRTLGTDLSKTIENNMESQLQLEDIRKAQRELRDAFSFRRSINTNTDREAYATAGAAAADEVVGTTSAFGTTSVMAATTTTITGDIATSSSNNNNNMATLKAKKIRRRVKKPTQIAAGNNEGMGPTMPVTDWDGSITTGLDPYSWGASSGSSSSRSTGAATMTDEEAAIIDREFEQYTSSSTKEPWTIADLSDDRISDSRSTIPSSYSIPSPDISQQQQQPQQLQQSRFQQQISGSWNEQIIAGGAGGADDKYSETMRAPDPLATVMNKIAWLEREKRAALDRLEEEFRQRKEIEDLYYQEQRKLLNDAAKQVQDTVLGLDPVGTPSTADMAKPQPKNLRKMET